MRMCVETACIVYLGGVSDCGVLLCWNSSMLVCEGRWSCAGEWAEWEVEHRL